MRRNSFARAYRGRSDGFCATYASTFRAVSRLGAWNVAGLSDEDGVILRQFVTLSFEVLWQESIGPPFRTLLDFVCAPFARSHTGPRNRMDVSIQIVSVFGICAM